MEKQKNGKNYVIYINTSGEIYTPLVFPPHKKIFAQKAIKKEP